MNETIETGGTKGTCPTAGSAHTLPTRTLGTGPDALEVSAIGTELHGIHDELAAVPAPR